MALCTVTGIVYLPTGEPARSRVFVFSPAKRSIYPDNFGGVLPDPVWVKTNRDGFLTVTLLDGTYVVQSEVYSGSVTVPDAESASLYSILTGGAVTPAPSLISAPNIEPSTVTVGDPVVITPGVYANAGTVARQLMQGAANVTSQINGNTWVPLTDIDAVYTETPIGAGGAGDTQTLNVIVNPAPVPLDYSPAFAYVSEVTAGIGPSTALTGIENDGASAWNYAVTGSGAEVQKVASGFSFANGKSMTSPNVSPVTTGGAFMVVEFTANSQGSASSIIIDTTPLTYMALRISGGNIQYGYHTGTAAAWTTLGPAVYGRRVAAGVEIDDDGKTVRAFLSGGEIQVVTGRTFEDRSFTATRLGAGFDGTIHRAVVVTRPAGQDWVLPFTDVLDDFNGAPVGVPKVTAPVVLNMARGQSLSAGPSPTALAPNGDTWQDVFYGNENIHYISGLRYTNGNPVTHIGQPMGQGYGTTVGEPSSRDMSVLTFITEGAVVSHGLVREALVPGVISHQWHDIGGISVTVIADPNGVPYKNAEHWLKEAMTVYDQSASVTVPRVIYNQGEADLAQPRGWWRDNFAVCWGGMVEQIRRITGQVTAPRLYMHQTGGYGNKTSDYFPVLDQIDAVVAAGGIMIGPNWAHLVDNYDNRMVHMTIQGHVEMSEMSVWAIQATEAGQDWNLFVPAAVARSGNTITIPVSVRGDETLTTEVGKYSSYGGDPVNLGLEVLGGGNITSATVSGGNIVLQVSGTVTAVRHAMQRNGIDTRTQLDSNGYGYVAHRSIIRTTLTRTRTVGGLELVLKRFIPSFEVTIT